MEDKKNLRVAFVANFVTPSRVSFFSKMARLPGVELLVLHGEVTKETGHPAAEIGAGWDFKHRVVRANEKRIDPFVVRWQSGVLPILRSFKPDVIVVSGISGTVSNWATLVWSRMHGCRTLMWMCGWEAQDRASFA